MGIGYPSAVATREETEYPFLAFCMVLKWPIAEVLWHGISLHHPRYEIAQSQPVMFFSDIDKTSPIVVCTAKHQFVNGEPGCL